MKHFTVPPFFGTGCVKNPRMSTLMNPSSDSKKSCRRNVPGDCSVTVLLLGVVMGVPGGFPF